MYLILLDQNNSISCEITFHMQNQIALFQMNLESNYIYICFHIIEFAYLRITDIDIVFRTKYSVNVSLK